jgi:hypothetical protein
VHECELTYSTETGWLIQTQEAGEKHFYSLKDCDVVLATDPAASEKFISAKTSRSASIVYARHFSNKRFILVIHADYVTPSMMFDWLFSDMYKFRGYARGTFLEAQGPFKILTPLLKEEERRRNVEALKSKNEPISLFVQAVTKTGEKDAVIRSTLDPILKQELLFVEKNCKELFMEELHTFPQSNRKDILDAVCLAEKATIRPMDETELEEEENERDEFAQREANVAGY